MRKQRAVVVGGGCVAILGAGWITSPKQLPDVMMGDGADAPVPSGAEVVEGPPIENVKGVYQVAIVVSDGRVTDIRPLQAGTMASESLFVNGMALPILEERMLEAQSWDVDYVSGASFTSPAIIESARGAFEAAGLG